MRNSSPAFVSLLISEITGNSFKYDRAVAEKVINNVYLQDLSATDALKYIYDHIETNRAGRSFNWSGALIYRLLKAGKKVAILLTPEPPDNEVFVKVSVAYCDVNELYVADIIEYVKGTVKSIDDISAIPYNEFVNPFGSRAKLIDVEKITGTYFGAIGHGSNTTPEQFLRKE